MALVVQDSAPAFLVKTATQSVSITVESDGQLVTPTAGTFSLYGSDGVVIAGLDAVAATTLGGTTSAAYTLNLAPVTVSYSDSYFIKWALTIAGVVHTFERHAMIVRRPVVCPATGTDLGNRLSALDDDYEIPPNKTRQTYIDEAWSVVVSRLLAQGVPVHLVPSMYSFREVVLRQAEYGWCRDVFTTRSGATKLQQLYEDLGDTDENPRSIEYAWRLMGYRVDRDNDGAPDTSDGGESRPGVYVQDAPDVPSRGW